MKGKARRLLSWVCVLALCMSLLPVTALATTGSGTKENPVTNTKNQVTVNKWVTGTGTADDPYTLTMEAYASNEVTSTTTTKPLDIVLVLDVSGSMDDGFGESGHVYSLVEGKTTWSYNNISSGEYYIYIEEDKEFYPVVGKADWEWDRGWTASNYRIGYETGSWGDPKFNQLGNTNDDPNEILVEDTTLYTRSYVEAGTKLDSMKTAVNSFINSVAKSAKETQVDHRISVVQFAYGRDAHSNYPTETVANLTSVNTEQGVADLKEAVNGLRANGATRADEGLKEAQTVLNRISADRNSQKVVVLFTDGEPTSGNRFEGGVAATAVNTAKEMKDDNVTIYTVGIFEGADPSDTTQYNANRYMNAVSSNYPSATAQSQWHGEVWPDWDELWFGGRASGNYYLTANNASGLEEVFKDIADTVTDSTLEVYPDAQAVLTDTLSQYFNFPRELANGNVTADVTAQYVPVKSINGETITWGEAQDLPDGTNLKVSVQGDTINIEGFDYVKNAVTQKEDGITGGKLVVSFPIELDEAACGYKGGTFDTNDTEKNLAGLYYKEQQEDEKNTESTLLKDSPAVIVTNEQMERPGTAIDIDVYVDGQPMSESEKVGTYVAVTPKDSGSFDEETDKVNYTFTYYDCKDIAFAAQQGYVIEAVDADLVYGQSVCQGITNTNGTVTADNVQGGSTVTVYVRTLYTIQYHGADGNAIGQPVLVASGQTSGLQDNVDTAMAQVNDNRPTTQDTFQENGTTYTYVNVCSNQDEHYADNNGDSTCDKHAAATNDGKQQAYDFTYVADLTTSETIDALPVDETGEMVYDGWFVGGSTSTTKLAPNEVFENGEKYVFETYDQYDEDDNVINLYCTSSAAQYAITIHFTDDGETPAELKDNYVEKKDRNTAYSYSPSDDDNAAVPVKIEYNEETYVFDHFNGNNSGTLTGDVEFTAVYSVDSNNNGVPDKYEATVTYKVVNGTWSDDTDDDETATFAMRSFDSASNTWVETNPTLDDQGNTIPTGMKPATGYAENSGSWGDNTPTENTAVENGAEYTYIFGSKLSYTLTVSYISDDGTALEKEPITLPINYGDSYDITGNGEGVYPQVISVGNDRYILEGPDEDSDPVSNESGVTGDVAITLVYTKDNWNDEDDTETGGDNIPDKYQAKVTYKVVGGTWSDGTDTNITEIFTLKTYNETTGQWEAADPTPTLGDSIPNGMKPSTGYVEPGNWDATISKDTLVTGNVTYTYTFPEANPGLTVVKEADETYVNVGEDIHYTVTVENTGNVALEDVKVIDILWKDGDVISVQVGESDPQNYEVADGSVTIPEIPVGDSAKIIYTYTTTKTGEVSNTVTVESPTLPDGPTSTTEKVSVYDPSVAIQKELTSVSRGESTITGDALQEFTAQVGDELTYQITVTNDGVGPLGKVDVTDSLWGHGVNTVYIGNREDGTPVTAGGTVTITGLNEDTSQTITYTYTVQPGDIENGKVTNTATASIPTDPDGPEETDTEEVPMDDYTVTITPADITIYTGGTGYGGVTDEEGNVITETETSGLPEPGYHIELPDAVVNWLEEQGIIASGSNADDVAANLSEYLTFTYDYADQTRDWSMGYAGIYSTNKTTGEPTRYVYTLNPANVDGEEIPVRLLYKNGEEVVSTDDILMSETLVSDQFSMTINPGELTQSQIRAKLTVEGQSISCNIDIQPGTLTVRSTTDKDTTTGIVDSQENVTSNTITAVDGGEVQYYVNNSEVTVDANRVQLLVDEVSNGEEFNAAMGDDAVAKVNAALEEGNTLSNAAYDLAYMDLVDTQNGNTVVTMGTDDKLTIYWPVPEDAAADSEFHVVHYTGMDRENTVDADKLSAQAADVKTGEDAVEKVTIGDQEQEYVKFTTSSFSPFALVYEKAPDPVASLDVTKTLTAVNGKTPGSSVSVGDTLTYTIKVTNNGNVDLTNVTVTDTMSNGRTVTWVNLPDGVTNENGTLTITSLAAGTSVELTATYKVLRADASSNLVNTAKVTGTNPGDPDTPVTDEVQTPETPVNPYRPPIRPPEDPDKPELNTEDHYAYIVGYEDGSVQPEGDITRAEVATIFFRLLTDESRNEYWSQTNPYSDVSADDWFNNAVSTLTNAGVLDGYEDGTFKPNGNITRAEFATITARFFEATYDGENLFPDIEGHWAQDYINEAANAGIVNGYEDGTFRPQQYITRAEAVTMVNRTIERHPDADHLLDDMIVWPDNPETAWYYEQIQEATNSHEYTMNTDDEQNPYEIWTKLLPNRDWSELEKEWSDANDGAGSGEVV